MSKINYKGSSKILKRLCEAVNDLIDNGVGIVVEAKRYYTKGNHIADIIINNTKTEIYAPEYDMDITQLLYTGVPIGEFIYGNKTTTLYAPEGGSQGSDVQVDTYLNHGKKIADITVDGNLKEIYAPSGKIVSPFFYNTNGQICADYDLIVREDEDYGYYNFPIYYDEDGFLCINYDKLEAA